MGEELAGAESTGRWGETFIEVRPYVKLLLAL